MEYKHVAVSCIVRDDKVLAVKRSKTQTLPGKWHLPGGKVEGSESFVQALKREIREELGLESVIGDMIANVNCLFPHGKYLLRFFRVELLEGEIKLDPADNEQSMWIPLCDINMVEWLPLDKQVAILGLLEGIQHEV